MIKPKNFRQKLHDLRQLAGQAGGKHRQKAQNEKGKLTAHQRIELLFDPGTFVELNALVEHNCSNFGLQDKKIPGDGVITGFGRINGRLVYAYAQDFTVFGGSLSETNAKKIVHIMQKACEYGTAIIGLCDSGGARIQEGVGSLGGYADIFYHNVQASGVVPQLTVIMGPCAGGAVYSPAITDFVFMVEGTSHMFITGPDVVKTVTSQEVSFDELGGAKTHCQISGAADLHFKSEYHAIAAVKKWLSYLPSNNLDHAERSFNLVRNIKKTSTKDENDFIQSKLSAAKNKIKNIVPDDAQYGYNVKEVINCIVDPESFFELKPEYAQNIVTGFARLDGYSVGIIANNSDHIAGVLDINASVKAARFVRFCDSFNIALITLVDVPGFLPGTDQEKGGIIIHGAKLLYAYCEATVPKLTVILRKAYGGAYDVMSSKHIGGDLNVAWPGAEIAVMGASGACNIIFKKQINQASDPQAERKKIHDNYAERFSNPYQAAKKGFIDAVIFPEETRDYLISALNVSSGKRAKKIYRKHGNIPL